MPSDRFLTLADVAEVLNISGSQTYALVRNKQLEAIKIGGRGQWRVERSKLEEFIARMYDQTRRFVDAHPFEAVAFDAPTCGQLSDPALSSDRRGEPPRSP